ncbi:cytochrome b561 and DOMON domain-containing protein At4g17280-like [Andrographis paniculata]|uniref:cytochrome b561 and DOMON domain-containing protein At4g17280-like n=1 Tax=Andrographis paniculata TaxID=175694 RepID=UPI0021E734EE|nr:cytochrome b561 and DOMON domain-containing protein At4g17280-like [Andrographis paniculata]
MLRMFGPVLIICTVLSSLYTPSHGQSCAHYSFASNQKFKSCNDLPHLNSFLHWDYDQSAKTVKIAYRHTGVSSSRWTAWGINPTGQGMVGAQALVAFQKSDGTMRAYTAPIAGYQTQLQQGNLSFEVSDLKATYARSEITIFASLKFNNLSSTVNQVWQEGPITGDTPGIHPTSGSNVQSTGTLNFLSGETGASSGGAVNSRTRKRNIHGLLNSVSWGILLPTGAVLARYLKVFPSADPAWFYLHATCQVSAYITGVTGWAIGIQLGSQSPGIQYTAHRVIGIVIFCLATLQVSAMLLRPKREHKHRFYWNIYHHFIGYSVIVLSIINIFKGFDILNPEKKWKRAYIGVLIGLACVAATLEVYTWCMVLRRKKSSQSQNMSNGINGKNGYNGYTSRPQDII